MTTVFPSQTELIKPLLEWIIKDGQPSIDKRDMTRLYKNLGEFCNLSEEAFDEMILRKNGSEYNHWENHVQWARFKAIKFGYLSNKIRGVWEITESGRDFIKSPELDIPGTLIVPETSVIQKRNNMNAKYKIIVGDATEPQDNESDIVIIPHICNDIGKWSSGFVLAINNRFGYKTMATYKDMIERKGLYSSNEPVKLGNFQFVYIGDEDNSYCNQKTFVINMIAQEGTSCDENGYSPIRYDALTKAMQEIAEVILDKQEDGSWGKVSIHCPKFGCGLAMGSWDVIEGLIKNIWVRRGLDVTVYQFMEKEDHPMTVSFPNKG